MTFPNFTAEKRTATDFKKDAMFALMQERPFRGVKGPSQFAILLDIPTAILTDYMHTILHGVLANDLHKILEGFNSYDKNIPSLKKDVIKEINAIILK